MDFVFLVELEEVEWERIGDTIFCDEVAVHDYVHNCTFLYAGCVLDGDGGIVRNEGFFTPFLDG